jgi:hypothetical protein
MPDTFSDDRPIICVDFDGCIHSNDLGYIDGTLYGDIVPGFFDWFFKIQQTFRPVIFSTRCGDPQQLEAMTEWFRHQYDIWVEISGVIEDRPAIEVTAIKIPAMHYIDDRAIRFQGNWQDPTLSPESLKTLYPWNRPQV